MARKKTTIIEEPENQESEQVETEETVNTSSSIDFNKALTSRLNRELKKLQANNQESFENWKSEILPQKIEAVKSEYESKLEKLEAEKLELSKALKNQANLSQLQNLTKGKLAETFSDLALEQLQKSAPIDDDGNLKDPDKFVEAWLADEKNNRFKPAPKASQAQIQGPIVSPIAGGQTQSQIDFSQALAMAKELDKKYNQ